MEQKKNPRSREGKLMVQGHGSLETTYQNASITKTSKPTLVFWLLIQGSSHQNMHFVALNSVLMGAFWKQGRASRSGGH